MKTLEFPVERACTTSPDLDLRSLCHVLNESAFLLEASNESDDPQFRVGSVELAIRALRAASTAIDRYAPAAPYAGNSVLDGPWVNTPTH